MNGQEPNMQENQNNLNNEQINPNPNNMDAFVLGGVQPAESLGTLQDVPVEPVVNSGVVTPNVDVTQEVNNQPVEPLNMGTPEQTEAVAQPIPSEMPINDVMTSQVGADPLMNNVNSNGFVEPQKVENIGIVPPTEEPKKEKKPMNKFIFILLILALIAGVAYGVYYYLSLGKTSKISVTPKTVELSLGNKLSENINDYATFVGTNSTNCVLNTTNVNTKKIGEYEYTITCGKESYNGKVLVQDKESPQVGLKVVYTTVNTPVDVSNFINYCKDASECTYAFTDAAQLNDKLSTVGGPYQIGIDVMDAAENKVTVEGELYVLPYDMVAQLSCTSTTEEMTDYKATKSVTDILTIGSNGVEVGYLNAGRREYRYTFNNKDDYTNIVGNKEYKMNFDNHSGLANYNDDELTMAISTDLDSETLNSEGTVPTAFADIQNYYIERGYTCEVLTQ